MLLLKNKLLFAFVLKEIENVGSPYAAVAVVVVGVIATVEEKKTVESIQLNHILFSLNLFNKLLTMAMLMISFIVF